MVLSTRLKHSSVHPHGETLKGFMEKQQRVSFSKRIPRRNPQEASNFFKITTQITPEGKMEMEKWKIDVSLLGKPLFKVLWIVAFSLL